MPLALTPQEIDVIILCGGLGTRLRGIINDRPKMMAEIKGRPFLDILIDHIKDYKFRRFILCVGYKADFIKEYYKRKSSDLTILFSEEKEPLGTAGAIKNAEKLIESNPFLAMNGDSFCNINMRDFLDFHMTKKAFISLALVSPEKDADYGVVRLDNDQRIISFDEKIKSGADSFINAGTYFFDRYILECVPKGTKYSLEYDLFPRIKDRGIYGYITKERLIDIGTPERYRMAEKLLIDNQEVNEKRA